MLYCVFKDCLTAITVFFNEKLHIIGYIGIGAAGVMVRIHEISNLTCSKLKIAATTLWQQLDATHPKCCNVSHKYL